MSRAHTESTNELPFVSERDRRRLGWLAPLRYLLRSWKARADLQRLMRASDHELHDIGIDRFDLESALSSPWHVDPSTRLAERRAERMRQNWTPRDMP